MPLYSTDTSSKVIKDKVQNEPQNPGPEEKICPQDSQTNSWCYLFVHHAKVETINEKLILKFKTFIHKSIAYIVSIYNQLLLNSLQVISQKYGRCF